MRVELVRIPVLTRVNILLRICVVDDTVVAVGVIGHEELHVGLLGLQPHGGWRCETGSGPSVPRQHGLPFPWLPAPPRLASPSLASGCPGGGRFPLPVPAPSLGWLSPAPPRRACGEGGHLSSCSPEPQREPGNRLDESSPGSVKPGKVDLPGHLANILTWMLKGRRIGPGRHVYGKV